MYLKSIKFLFLFLFLLSISFTNTLAEIIKKIKIEGNDRVSDDTIKLFSEVKLNDDLSTNDLNNVLKKLYKTNFFKKIKLKIDNNTLLINVLENPIIENINYTGLKKNF